MHPHPIVLLVQPERDDRDMYAEYLRAEGFAPVLVSTAADARRLAHHADVIVTGVLLPGDHDGVELVRRLKADDRTKRLPVIVVTACASPSDRERAEAAGCAVFLTKPCLPDALVREIRRVLGLRRLPKPSAVDAPPPGLPRFRRSS